MKTTKYSQTIIAISVSTLLSACGGGGGQEDAPKTNTPTTNNTNPIDSALTVLFAQNQLSANPLEGRELPSINDPVPQLGRALFFSKTLSGDKDVACVSCHHPLLAGADELSLSVGVNPKNPNLLGLGRVLDIIPSDDPVAGDGPNVPRNAPTTFNIALYDRAMFHDGRAFVLDAEHKFNGVAQKVRTPDSFFQGADPHAGANLTEAQVRFPVTSLFEMRGFGEFSTLSNEQLRNKIAQRLQENPVWVAKFKSAFNTPSATAEQIVTPTNIFRALSEYQRSQVFMDLPFFDYMKGNTNAMTNMAKEGAKLFYTSVQQGGAGCASCHSGSHFSDEKFYVTAFPQIGRGKDTFNEDEGRREVTQQNEDRFAFRTPSLVNVGKTAPYGHAGSFANLQDTIRYHINPRAAFATYDKTLKTLPQFQTLTVTYPNLEKNTLKAIAAFENHNM